LKFTKYRMAAGLCPDPLGGLKRSPRPSSRNNGGLLLREREGRGGEGRGGEGKWEGGEGKGRGRGGGGRGGDLTCTVLTFPLKKP